jgi:rubrerythrin
MNTKQVEELVLQSLEHELGGIKVYAQALECAVNAELKAEWTKYLEQTKTHVTALESMCAALGFDAGQETPGRGVVRHVANALVEAMQLALRGGDPQAAQLVACECVVLAETKDHADWQLLGKCADNLENDQARAEFKQAYDTVEDQEDEHLYHSKGWCRELWIQALGLKAVLPPPEERQHATTAIGAAKAEQAADKARLVNP